MTTTEIPAELGAKLLEAERSARGVLEAAKVAARLGWDLDLALMELHRERGGTDHDFDRLMSLTDELGAINQQIATLMVSGPSPERCDRCGLRPPRIGRTVCDPCIVEKHGPGDLR